MVEAAEKELKKERVELPPDDDNIGDFFKESDSDMSDFLNRMQTPKEEIPHTAIFGDEDDDETDDLEGDSLKESDESNPFAYLPEHKQTAEFILLQLDKGIAFAASLVTGENMEKYQIRLKETPSRKQETELAAALVRKYHMKMNVEVMFLLALAMAYAPVGMAVRKDLKAKKEKERQQHQQHNGQYAAPPQRPI